MFEFKSLLKPQRFEDLTIVHSYYKEKNQLTDFGKGITWKLLPRDSL